MTWKCPKTGHTHPGKPNEKDEEIARNAFRCYNCELNCRGARYDGEDSIDMFVTKTGEFYHYNAMCGRYTMPVKVGKEMYDRLLKEGKICHKCVNQKK